MKWSWLGRVVMALTSAVALGLSMTACGGGTVAYIWATGLTSGQQAGQIVGYWVDNYTGNLTAIPGEPFSSNDSNPVQIVVRPGGRFVYVINQGTGYGPGTNGTSDGIDLFAIGGFGTLTFEQHYETQGFGHLWAQFDTTGGFLYVLDKYNPTYQPDRTKANYNPDANGAITTFSSDGNTGRLQLVQQTASTQAGQISPTYLEVGQNPIRMLSGGGGCLFTINSSSAAGQNVSTYSIANGQLGTVTNGFYTVTNATSINSISGNGQYVFITDNQNGSGTGYIYSYTVSNCALTPLSPGAVTKNSTTAVNPVNTFLSTSGKYLYVLNSSNTSTQPNAQGSTISAFNLNANQLTEITGSPFSVGNGPTCMVEDPTSKFVYTINSGDGTITGFQYSDTLGQLAQLSRGSKFTTTLQSATCLALSGAV